MTRRFLLATLAPMFGAVSTANAQDAAPPTPASLFTQTFPKPTGKNGFEEIVRAMERLKAAKAPYPPERVFTLTKKRAYLSDPACRGALSLIRQGLRKPIVLSVSEETPVSVTMTYPRSLARLIATRVYVGMADGDGASVVSDATAFLRYVDTLKAVSVLSGATGWSLERIVLAPLVKLRDAWTMRDAQRLLTFAQNRANAPDPAIAALGGERKLTLAGWQKIHGDPELLAEQFGFLEGEEEEGTPDTAREYAEALRESPDLMARVNREMPDAIAAYYDRAAALQADPTKTITLLTPPGEKDRFHPITLYLRDSIVPDANFAGRQPVENRVSNQLLGVHAAIRAYRWENDRLPKTLDELRLPPNLVTDPFTGAPLLYEPVADTYRLETAGALLPGEDGKQERKPYSFTSAP
ncbi:MAG: hypothetical protein H7Y38_17820 [Armatimonadetes bacterium]|nr:hypothetical protein [Armatimonadota bacterium]